MMKSAATSFAQRSKTPRPVYGWSIPTFDGRGRSLTAKACSTSSTGM